MNHAGIPKKRQAAPQAPPRDFKPRKNGTPAVPATPPANMPGQAFAPQQPPMRGAAQSMAPQRAPQRAMRRAQGGFNPMRGPMGADMSRAREAAASMFMDGAPKPIQPSMPPQPKKPPSAMPQNQMQQSAMQQKAPKQEQVSQPQDLTPAQQAAIDIAGMAPPEQTIKMGAPGSGGQPQDMDDIIAALESQVEQKNKQDEQDKKDANTKLLEAALQGKGKEYVDNYIKEFGIEAFLDTFGEDVYADFFGDAIPETPARSLAPTKPEPEEMIPAEPASEPAPESATVDSTLQALRDELRDLLGSEGEGFFTDEELAAQGMQVKAGAQQAASNLAQQMAMRGMGASGLAGVGFGDIAAAEASELTDLAVQNKIAGDEQRRANIAAISGMLTALTGDETKKELFEMAEKNRRTEQEVADSWNFLNNELGLSLGDKWDSASKADALEALYNGMPVYEVMRNIRYDVRKDEATGNDIRVAFYDPSPPTEEELVAEAMADESDEGTPKDITPDEWSQSFANMENYEKKETMFMVFASKYADPPPSAEDGMVYDPNSQQMVPYADLPPAARPYHWKKFWEDVGVDWRKYSEMYYT